ncbi:MAG: AbrB/MazE/SpoVT family DNA-binding domain-containing protein [Candidatus Saccharibacteria bacterium]|nr:AbrB/MazE/SpoVT family DNA-binding domain-containing protein [Rhodoferax sp.]
MTTIAPTTAKVFTTGRSQAVRLPKAFRFDTAEVTIEKVGDAVVLRPKPSKEDWWAEMEKVLAGFEGMDFIEREYTPDADDILSFDDHLPESE